MHHEAALKELRFPGLVVGHRATDAVVDAPRTKIGLKLRVNGLRAVPIKPCVQLFQLARRQHSDCPFNFLASLPLL